MARRWERGGQATAELAEQAPQELRTVGVRHALPFVFWAEVSQAAELLGVE